MWRGIHCANTGSSAALLPSHRDQCGYSAECVDRAEQWSGECHTQVFCAGTISTGTSASSQQPAAAPLQCTPLTSSAEKWCGPAAVLQPSTQQLSTRRHSDTATSQAHVMCFIPFDPSPGLSTVSTVSTGGVEQERAQARCQCWSQCHASHTTAHILLWCG